MSQESELMSETKQPKSVFLLLQFLCTKEVHKFKAHFSLPRGPPNLVKIIVSHATSYIVSFNFLRQSIQNSSFWARFLESPLMWGLKKTICKYPVIGLPFHQLSDFYIKRSSRTSDRSEGKKKN